MPRDCRARIRRGESRRNACRRSRSLRACPCEADAIQASTATAWHARSSEPRRTPTPRGENLLLRRTHRLIHRLTDGAQRSALPRMQSAAPDLGRSEVASAAHAASPLRSAGLAHKGGVPALDLVSLAPVSTSTPCDPYPADSTPLSAGAARSFEPDRVHQQSVG